MQKKKGKIRKIRKASSLAKNDYDVKYFPVLS